MFLEIITNKVNNIITIQKMVILQHREHKTFSTLESYSMAGSQDNIYIYISTIFKNDRNNRLLFQAS